MAAPTSKRLLLPTPQPGDPHRVRPPACIAFDNDTPSRHHIHTWSARRTERLRAGSTAPAPRRFDTGTRPPSLTRTPRALPGRVDSERAGRRHSPEAPPSRRPRERPASDVAGFTGACRRSSPACFASLNRLRCPRWERGDDDAQAVARDRGADRLLTFPGAPALAQLPGLPPPRSLHPIHLTVEIDATLSRDGHRDARPACRRSRLTFSRYPSTTDLALVSGPAVQSPFRAPMVGVRGIPARFRASRGRGRSCLDTAEGQDGFDDRLVWRHGGQSLLESGVDLDVR